MLGEDYLGLDYSGSERDYSVEKILREGNPPPK